MKKAARVSIKSSVIGAMVGAISCHSFAASDLSLVGGLGLEAHDNAGLTHHNEESDTKRMVSADIGYKKDDGELNADIAYQAEYGDYAKDVQSDETAINGRSALTWQIAPHQLNAILSHQITQQLTDRRGVDVASNHEERSIVTAGFDGFLHLSPVDSVVLAPRFSDVRFQESNNSDSRRASMAATWEHMISKVTTVGVQANYTDVKFDDSVNDYRSPGVMVSLQTALSRLSYQIGLGATRIDRDHGDDFSGSTVLAGIDYRGEEGQSWGASYVRQLTDNSVGLSAAEMQLTNFRSNDSNAGQFDIIQTDKVDAYWRDRLDASNEISAGIGYMKEDYKELPNDQEVAYAQLGYDYTINSSWTVGATARFERTKFLDEPTSEYDLTGFYLRAIYRVSRPLEVHFSVGQDKRDADPSNTSYTDNVAMASLRYRFF